MIRRRTISHLVFSLILLSLVSSIVGAVNSAPAVATSGVRARELGAVGANSCYRTNLEGSPSWISSAVWIDRLSEILVIDPLRNKVLLYGQDGTLRKFPDPRLAEVQFPSVVKKSGAGFLLQSVGNSFLSIDQNLNIRTERKLLGENKGGREAIGSLYDWTIASNDLVAYGSLRNPDTSIRMQFGFLRAPLSSPSDVEMLQPFDNGDYYVLGHTYVTSIGSRAYFVRMTSRPTIFEASRSPNNLRELEAFPPDYQQAPLIRSDMSGPASAKALFAEIEKLTIPVGLYNHENMLYLLTRRWTGERTEWRLFKIDPQAREPLGSVILPTSANAWHLTVLPTAQRFFIFEKEHVGDYGQQKIPTILALPSTWITALSIPKDATCPTLGGQQ